MKITTEWKLNIKDKEVQAKVDKAVKKGIVDTITVIAQEAIHESPVITGHNRRSIAYKFDNKVTRTGSPRAGEKPFNEGEPSVSSMQGAVYSTSGYGGYLETGTVRMGAQPYMKPALDHNYKDLPKRIKSHLDSGL